MDGKNEHLEPCSIVIAGAAFKFGRRLRACALVDSSQFATNHHLADHLIGPGKPMDTDKYFVICPDELGSTQISSEHSTCTTNCELKMNFPTCNGRDRVKVE
jgi:homoserine acetyltransferase